MLLKQCTDVKYILLYGLIIIMKKSQNCIYMYIS